MKKIIKKVLKKFLNCVIMLPSQETTITSSRVLPRNYFGWLGKCLKGAAALRREAFDNGSRKKTRQDPAGMIRVSYGGEPMMTADFEELLARQCAPTFTGLKAASLVAFQKDRFVGLDAQLAAYEPCFACHGISLFRLLDEESRSLVLFYRADILRAVLRRRGARMLLRRYGYRPSDSLSALLMRLRRRVCLSAGAGAGFPHEIGLFLGYPPHDVRGFIENKGRGFLCCGPWKVYADADASRALFKRYADCTARFCTRLASGVPMAEILQAV